MNTKAAFFRSAADAAGIPLRTLEQVKASLAAAKRKGTDADFAALMLKHGRLTDEAILYIGDTYANVWE